MSEKEMFEAVMFKLNLKIDLARVTYATAIVVDREDLEIVVRYIELSDMLKNHA